jgi:AcrR family transcriptional regulator
MVNSKRRVVDPELVAKRLPLIIDAAIQQFGKNGFHATTIQDVAKAAGISIGMIYQYVRDKENLLYLAVLAIAEECLREAEVAVASAATPIERYLTSVAAVARVIDRRHAEAVMGYRESHSMSREHLDEVMVRERQIGRIMTDAIGECIRTGVFRSINADMLMYQSIILAHNWPLNAWRLKRGLTVDTYLNEGLNLLLKPVLADESMQKLPLVRVADAGARERNSPRLAVSRKKTQPERANGRRIRQAIS